MCNLRQFSTSENEKYGKFFHNFFASWGNFFLAEYSPMPLTRLFKAPMSLRYELVVRAGTDNPQKIRSIEKKILRHIPHPKYEGTFYFDVALIILEEVSFIKPRIKII